MNSRIKITAIIGAIIILFGLFLATLPVELPLIQEEYTSLESYPKFYHANFTISSTAANPELILDFDIDYANIYSSHTILWMILQLTIEQFEEDFNISEAHSAMGGEDWNLDPFWHGWFTGHFSSLQDVILPDVYVIVFWIDTDGSISGWSVTLKATLSTSLLPRS